MKTRRISNHHPVSNNAYRPSPYHASTGGAYQHEVGQRWNDESPECGAHTPGLGAL